MPVVKYYAPALVWGLFILLLTMMPGKYVAPANFWDIANFDKLAHLFVFLVLMFLSLHGRSKQIQSAVGFRFMLFAFLLCVAYGFLLEMLQGLISTDRQFEMIDAFANMLGCLLGAMTFRPVRAIIKREPR